MKKKNWSVLTLSLLVLAGLSNEAQAYPMFGKQTGLDCKACHMQHMPKLTAVGRQFAVSGMTQSNKSLDANNSKMDLHASVMFKALYEETWDKPSADGLIQETSPTAGGDWSVPRTASLFVGGRVSDHIGALIDLSYKDLEDNSIQGKIVYAKEIKDGYMGAAAYSTAGFGPFSGMETYNTGLYKPLRTFDIRKLSNAFQACEIGSGSGTGIQLYFDRDNVFRGKGHLFATVGMFTPTQDNANMQMSDNILRFARGAYEYPIGDFNFIIGGFGINGGSQVSATDPLSVQQDSYGIDFQLEGLLLGKSVSLVMSKVLQNKVTYTGVGANLLNPEENTNLNSKAFSVEGEINIFQDFGLKAAYLTFDDLSDYTQTINGDSGYARNHRDVRDIDHAYTVGADYSFELYLPMKLAIEHSWAKPSLERVKDYRDFLVSLNILF